MRTEDEDEGGGLDDVPTELPETPDDSDGSEDEGDQEAQERGFEDAGN